jgi:hypothetical protein
MIRAAVCVAMLTATSSWATDEAPEDGADSAGDQASDDGQAPGTDASGDPSAAPSPGGAAAGTGTETPDPATPGGAAVEGEPTAQPPVADTAPPVDAAKPVRNRFSDFVRTRLTFYVGDDNLLAGNADRSPSFGIGNQYPELFFEGLNNEKAKVVTETYLVIYGKAPGFLPFLDTEGAFVAELSLSRDPDDGQLIGRFRDKGSWLLATFWLKGRGQGPKVELTAWPFSADRFRLGYTYDLTWGGDKIWARNRGPVPGFKLNVDLERFYAFVGAKSLPRLRADNNEVEQYWGVLGGLGPNIPIGKDDAGRLSYDLGGGWFSRGTFQQDPHRATPVVGFGLSHRVMFTWKTRMGASPDLKQLRNDPDRAESITNIPTFDGPFGFGVSAELTTLWQTLIDPADVAATRYDDAITGALTAQVHFLRSMRVGFDLVYRDVSFLVFNVPGLVPYVGFAEGTEQRAQLYGAFWWDAFIDRAKLTPGFIVGLMQPAAFLSAEDDAGNRQLEVIREANDYEIMPEGSEPFTILSLKGSLKWHLSPMMAMVGEIAFTQDYNQSRVITDPGTGVGVREIDEARARQLGLNLMLQAAF